MPHSPQEDDADLMRMLARAASHASAADSAVGTHEHLSETLLTQYDAKNLSPEMNAAVMQHLIACSSCRHHHIQRRLTVQSKVSSSTAAVMRKAIAVAVFGPTDVSHVGLRHCLGTLKPTGAHASALDAEPVWMVQDISTSADGADPIDARRLATWVKQVAEAVQKEGTPGVLITAGRGLIGKQSPFGAPFDEARDHHKAVLAGEVLLSHEVASRLEPLGMRVAPTNGLFRLLPAPGVLSIRPPSAEPSAAGQATVLGKVLTRISWGFNFLSEAVGWQLSPIRSARSNAQHAEALHLGPNDRLRLQLNVPAGLWAYLLLEQNQRLILLEGGQPIHLPENPGATTLDVSLAGLRGPIQPYLLVTSSTLQDLAAQTSQANQLESSADPVVIRLALALSEQSGLSAFVFLELSKVRVVAMDESET